MFILTTHSLKLWLNLLNKQKKLYKSQILPLNIIFLVFHCAVLCFWASSTRAYSISYCLIQLGLNYFIWFENVPLATYSHLGPSESNSHYEWPIHGLVWIITGLMGRIGGFYDIMEISFLFFCFFFVKS